MSGILPVQAVAAISRAENANTKETAQEWSKQPVSDIFDQLYIADDMGMAATQFRTQRRPKATETVELNPDVEHDIEGRASDTAQEIKPATSAPELLQMLWKRFSDISDVWLALQMMIANSRQWQLDRLLLEAAQDMLEAEASAEERQALWAGVNTHGLTQQYARLTQLSARQLRIWYRVWLSWDDDDDASFLWGLVDELACSQLSDVFHFISRALRQDINALRPSTQPDRLQTLLGKITALTRFNTVVQRICTQLSSATDAGEMADNPLANQIAQFIKTILHSPVSILSQWDRLALALNELPTHNRAHFLGELRAAIQALPDLFFTQQSDRGRLDGKVVQLLDEHWQTTQTGSHDVEC